MNLTNQIHPALQLYNYHVWANQMIFKRLKELPAEVYKQEVQSVFPTVSKVMAHIYTADLNWLKVCSGVPMNEAMPAALAQTGPAEACTLSELEAWYNELSAQYEELLREHPPETPLEIDNPYAGILHSSIAETLQHVSLHGTYHRGNLTAMLRQMGHAGIMHDFGLYLYAK